MSSTEIVETAYVRLLYTLLTNSLVLRDTLLELAENKQTMYRYLKSAKIKRHIREYSTAIKVQSRERKITYYSITHVGINYLSQSDFPLPEEMLWVKEIPPQTKLINPFGSINRNGPRIYRHLLISDSNVFLSSIGAETLPLLLPLLKADDEEDEIQSGLESDEFMSASNSEPQPTSDNNADADFDIYIDEYCEAGPTSEGKAPPSLIYIPDSDDTSAPTGNDSSLCSLVLNSIKAYKSMEQNFNGIIRNSGSGIKYTHIRELSNILPAANTSDMAGRGKLVGILEAPLKSVVIYEGSRIGMQWDKWSTGKDRQIYQQYGKETGSRNIRKGEGRGILLVDNSRTFRNLYMNKGGKRQGEGMGGDLNSLIIIPTDKNGKRNIKEYMSTETEKQLKEIETAAVESGQFKKRVGRYERVFPLESIDGTLTAVGIYIDSIKIRDIEEAEKKLKAPYQIICREWQCEYYSRVLPNAKYVILETSQDGGDNK